MDWTLEVVVLPVSDLDRSIAFYRDQVGFALDHDTENEHMHVAQLTPPGSGCSIVIGDGITDRTPGTQEIQIVVADAEAARKQLLEAGVEASEVDPQPWGNFVFFRDPDGNSWALQALESRPNG